MAGPIDELRRLAATGAADDEELEPYLEKVRAQAYTVTDGDIERLKAAGISEDRIFEATVAIAIGEGLRRLDVALEVIG